MTTTTNETGVILATGAQDWQIFQQRANGTADITIAGRWLTTAAFKKARVVARLMLEDECRAVAQRLDWQPATTGDGGTWSMTFTNVPAGGLYRIETGLQLDETPLEWSQRGDAVHHLGVGDVWVIAGQSNAAGYGKTPVLDPPEVGLHMFHASGAWKLAAHPLADSTQTRYPANREAANGSHSPFLGFARTLKRQLGYPIGLIPAALGGSPLSAWLQSQDGTLFRNMLDYIRDAGGGVRGVCWYQGCSDTGPEQSATYLERFREFVGDLRKALKQPRLPVITAQINRVISGQAVAPGNAGWDDIREAQRQAARRIPGVYVISTLDCGLSDCIHNHSAANLIIGERMAAMALGQLFGCDRKCLHPDLTRAKRESPTAIDLVFANVNDRLLFDVVDPVWLPFAVQDKAGAVPLAGIKFPAPDTIRLELGRPLQGKATVIGAPGTNPPSPVPFDVPGFLPMLAFKVPVR